MTNLAEIRAERRATSIATAVLADLEIIQDGLIGYFHARRAAKGEMDKTRTLGL